MLRLTLDGRLVGQRLDRTGLTGMRFGTRWFKEAANQTSPAQVEETDLGVDFCLTWDSDPRLILPFLSYVKAWFPWLFIICNTRPKPAYGRQGLDWIVGPEYSFVVTGGSN